MGQVSESHPEPVVPAEEATIADGPAAAPEPVDVDPAAPETAVEDESTAEAAAPVDQPSGDGPSGDEPSGDGPSGDGPSGDEPSGDEPGTDESGSDESDESEEADGEDTVPEEPTWTRIALDGDAAEAVLNAVEDGGVVVLPTDTVYGIGVDAYNATAVNDLLAAKGRGRDVPPPVLIGDGAMLKALAQDVPDTAEQLIAQHWPGPLTVIVKAAPKLKMDLGETGETIGVRVPAHDQVREILRHTGPMAVSSANKTGEPAATTIDDAIEQLGNAVALYVDGGDVSENGFEPSTMVDFSKRAEGIILRVGAIDVRTIRETLPEASTLRPEDDPDLPEEPEEPAESADAEESDSAAEGDQTADLETPNTETPNTETPDPETPDIEVGTPGEDPAAGQADGATEADPGDPEVPVPAESSEPEESVEDHAVIAAQIHGANEDTVEDPGPGDEPTKAPDA